MFRHKGEKEEAAEQFGRIFLALNLWPLNFFSGDMANPVQFPELTPQAGPSTEEGPPPFASQASEATFSNIVAPDAAQVREPRIGLWSEVMEVTENTEISEDHGNRSTLQGAQTQPSSSNVELSAETGIRRLLEGLPHELQLQILKKLLVEKHNESTSKPKKKKKSKKTKGAPQGHGSVAANQDRPGQGTQAAPLPNTKPSGDAGGCPVDTDGATPADGGLTSLKEVAEMVAQDFAHRQAPLERKTEEDTGDPWKHVTYKRAPKRVREEPAEVLKPPNKTFNRFFELKVRLTRSQTSIKPYLQSFKMQCCKYLPDKKVALTLHLLENANIISIRTDSEEVARHIQEIKTIQAEDLKELPVQVFRTYGNTYVKGVIYDLFSLTQDRDDHTLNNELESNKIQIVAARRLGKTNTAIITFDGDQLPRSILYGNIYKRVFPYKPKAVVCANCHCLGHKEDICPNSGVCTTCGQAKHAMVLVPDTGGMQCAGDTPFCQGCKKAGHLATSNSCPIRKATNMKMREEHQRFRKQQKQQTHLHPGPRERLIKIPVPPSGGSWADRVKNGKQSSDSSKPDGAAPPDFRNLYLYLRAETEAIAKHTEEQLERQARNTAVLQALQAFIK